jgi:hypothetical protein
MDTGLYTEMGTEKTAKNRKGPGIPEPSEP